MPDSTVISQLAEINPRTHIPLNLPVSFIGMEDVSESFTLIRTHQNYPGGLRQGYTRFTDGDLLFAKITPCMENGKGAQVTGLTSGFGLGSTEFHVIRAQDPKSARFIAQLLMFNRLRRAAEAQMTGSAGQRRVPRSFFDRFPILDIPVDEQQRLADILDTLDNQTHSTVQIIAKLSHARSGLLEHLIGQRPRTVALADALLGSPANGIYKPAHLIGKGSLLVGQTAIDADRRVVSSMARRALTTPIESNRFGLTIGDILVSRVFATLDGVGQPALVEELEELATFESNMMRLRCDQSKADPYFAFQTLLTRSARSHIMRRANLSNQASISQEVLSDLPVWLPGRDEQLRVSAELRSVDAAIEAERGHLMKLRAVKAGLMDDLLSGRVRVLQAAS